MRKMKKHKNDLNNKTLEEHCVTLHQVKISDLVIFPKLVTYGLFLCDSNNDTHVGELEAQLSQSDGSSFKPG